MYYGSHVLQSRNIYQLDQLAKNAHNFDQLIYNLIMVAKSVQIFDCVVEDKERFKI